MARRPAMIKRKPKTIRVTKSEQYIVNRKYLGDEPLMVEGISLNQCFTWYNYMCTTNDARDYLKEYFKNTGKPELAKKLSRISDCDIPLTAAWIARMISRGHKPEGTTMQFFSSKILNMWDKAKEEPKQDSAETPKVSIQDRMRERMHDILGEIEGLIDDYMYKNEEFSLYEWLQANNIPAAYATSIISKFSPVLDELLEAYEGKDEQLKEGYRHLKKADLKKIITFYNTLIEDAERYSSNTKKVRTARKPRTVSVEKKIKNLKFQKEDATLKIVSVSPEKVIGAMELWTYNTKYKVFTRLVAIDRGGLQVKGTSITNYDENSSISRSVGRKEPTEFLKRVLEGGKLVLRKVLDELKTEKPLAYRINENTILLRVVQ
ncbi:MAG: hypothetical protein ABFD50_21065 [Smithella sp.]